MLGALLCLTFTATWATGARCAPSFPDTFTVEHGRIRLEEGVYYADARVDIDLSARSREALRNGVPLTFDIEFKVYRKRRWLWDETVASLEARYSVKLHQLSGQYVMRNVNLGLSQSYPTLESLRDALSHIEHFPLIDARLLDRGAPYWWGIRARLDIESLPAPLRPLAYLQSMFALRGHQGWRSWPLSR